MTKVSCSILLLLLSSIPVSAQTEIAPLTPHGFLNLIDAEDYYTSPAGKIHGGFYAVTGVPLGSKFYFYVGSGATNGFPNGPGSQCPFEDTMVFSVNYNHQGMRGTDNSLTFLDIVSPCDSSFHLPGGAFLLDRTWKGDPAKVWLTIDSSDSNNFSLVQLGTSSDGVLFDWDTLLTVPNGQNFGIAAPHLQPDPYQPNRLFGLADVIINGSAGPSTCIQVTLGTQPANSSFSLAANPTCTTWKSYPFGAAITMPALISGTPSMSIQGIQRIDETFQVFGGRATSPSSTPPCLPGESTSLYLTNVSMPGNSNQSTQEVVSLVMGTNFEFGAPAVLESLTRALPMSYVGALITPFATEDKQGLNLLYSASQNASICRLEYGAGIGFKGDIVLTALDEDYFDVVFSDGFENGLNWTAISDPANKLAITSSAALVGSLGLSATLNGNTQPAHLRDDSPTEEARYHARFYFDPNGLSMGSAQRQPILEALSTGLFTDTVLQLTLRENGPNFQLSAKTLLDDTTWAKSPWLTITDSVHFIEVAFSRATVPGANNGNLKLWIDNVLVADLVSLDNDTRLVSTILLGVPSGVDPQSIGSLHFDQFEARRSSQIGP